MSYILEALKKAQAERQLGSSPTLHAPTLQGEQASPAARFSLPLIAAVVGMAAVIGVLLVLVWRPAEPATPAPSVAPAVPPAAQASALAPAVMPAAPTPLPAPVADLPPSVANLARAAAPAPAASAATASAAGVAAAPAPVAAAKPAAAAEEPVVNLRELPEPIQRSIPPVSVGGYIYSKNAADRLLLVDKVLRREGEEVAPGLILEKLQPKEAVFNFKGYRYRVPY
ncbi:general secretion pathway protein GspB [Duganella sp. sic0402]|uniref:general secretion pathway protein GspB n=1 Tax=Duganella sp. sic0402 TaxID=2854786 RepID=UPI001C4678B3|nr:general secretion pathway protein GspB [Duganella sp. sic0402]MBV7536115.1 general secretion pathway protein GspB [Duganella sp. sic0402]